MTFSVGNKVRVLEADHFKDKDLIGQIGIITKHYNETNIAYYVRFLNENVQKIAEQRYESNCSADGLVIGSMLLELVTEESSLKKDYCHHCSTDMLYWQAMAAKCCFCHRVILGG